MKTTVSIIMPAYNCERYIAEAIQSVLDQTMEDWELIIVDDCSTDKTKQIINSYLKDLRIHYLCLEQNGGPAAARNAGLAKASGEYVAFLDSDDIWLPNKLERQLEFIRQNMCVSSPFCCTAYEKIDKDGVSLRATVYPFPKAGYWKVFFTSNPIGNSTVLFDRSFFENPTVPMIQKRNDFALWLKMLRNGSYCYGMQEPLALYRVRGDSISSKKLSLAKYHWELYRKIEKKSLLISVGGMFGWAFFKGVVPKLLPKYR